MSPRRNWDSANPSLASQFGPPPRTGGGAHWPTGEGVGESQFRRLEKQLSTLPTLWSDVSGDWGWRKRAFTRRPRGWLKRTECVRYYFNHCLKVLNSEKRGGLKVVSFDRSSFKLFTLRFSNKSVQIPSCESLKVLSEPCICYLNAIIVCKHSINIGLCHRFHIVTPFYWNKSSLLTEKTAWIGSLL
jgi:hypothetical protein